MTNEEETREIVGELVGIAFDANPYGSQLRLMHRDCGTVFIRTTEEQNQQALALFRQKVMVVAAVEHGSRRMISIRAID